MKPMVQNRRFIAMENKLLGAVYGYYDAEPGTDNRHYLHFIASICLITVEAPHQHQ